LKAAEFSPLNVVILKRTSKGPVWPLGIADEVFAQRKPDKGLITKQEVRVLSLAQLQLRIDSIVWDIGTCTGSVAIEAARIAREGQVFAIEKNEGDLQNCIENSAKFRADLTTFCGKAPHGLDLFPDPDAVFIGGSGGELEELLGVCCRRLKPGGSIVLNAVTIENLYEAKLAFEREGFAVRITQVQVSRSKPILQMTRFEALNPVYIITARHQADSGTETKEAAVHE
jgi:precorrin-6Y C5,15-methyltransferase (decarboxylating)